MCFFTLLVIKIALIATLTIITVVTITALTLAPFQIRPPLHKLFLFFFGVITVSITLIILLFFFAFVEDQVLFELAKPVKCTYIC